MKSIIKNDYTWPHNRTTKVCKSHIGENIENVIHLDDGVIHVASNMKPGAGIGKGRIPALQHIVWVLPCQPLLVQYVTFKSQKHVSEKTT